MSEKKWLKEVSHVLADIESDMAENDQSIRDSKNRSDAVLTLFVVFIISFALANVYFVFEWTQEAASMIHEVEEVHHNLENISKNMVVINESMTQLRNQTLLMNILDEEMGSFVNSMQNMDQATSSMLGKMQLMNQSMNGINSDMLMMNQQFGLLNMTVNQMGVDINEMSQVVP